MAKPKKWISALKGRLRGDAEEKPAAGPRDASRSLESPPTHRRPRAVLQRAVPAPSTTTSSTFHPSQDTNVPGYEALEPPPPSYTVAAPPQRADIDSNRAAQLLQRNGFNPYSAAFPTDRAFMWAVENGHPGPADFLLQRGIGEQIRAKAMFIAIYKGHTDVVQCLLENGTEVNLVNTFGREVTRLWESSMGGDMPLHLAARCGRNAIINLLLAYGAEINATNTPRRTAMYVAAKEGHASTTRVLLENGSWVSVTDKYGETALHRAARLDHRAVVDVLIENKIDSAVKNPKGELALHLAGQNGHKEIFEKLVAYMSQRYILSPETYRSLHGDPNPPLPGPSTDIPQTAPYASSWGEYSSSRAIDWSDPRIWD